jgi:hypothetical protein
MGGVSSATGIASVAAPFVGAIAQGAFGDSGSQATDAQVQAAGQSADVYNQYIQQALQAINGNYGQARNDLTQNYTSAIGQGAPYNYAGLNALDLLQQGIGMPTLPGGSFSLSQALQNNNALTNYNTGLSNSEKTIKDLGQQWIDKRWDPSQLSYSNMYGAVPTLDQKIGEYNGDLGAFGQSIVKDITGVTPDQASSSYYKTYSGLKDPLTAAIADYNKYKNASPPPSLTPQQQTLVDQYNNGTLNQSATYDKNAALTNFFNTPEYQLLFNQGGATTDPNATVLDRFRADPGYQFALDQGTKRLDASAAAQGNLLSGNQLQAITDYGQGMADQQFGNYQNKISQTLGNYLGRLGGVAGYGTQFAANNQNLYSGQGNALSSLGQNQGNSLSNIYTNQGAVNANAILAAGNARASGYANDANFNNQIVGSVGNGLTNLLSGSNFSGSAVGDPLSAALRRSSY